MQAETPTPSGGDDGGLLGGGSIADGFLTAAFEFVAAGFRFLVEGFVNVLSQSMITLLGVQQIQFADSGPAWVLSEPEGYLAPAYDAAYAGGGTPGAMAGLGASVLLVGFILKQTAAVWGLGDAGTPNGSEKPLPTGFLLVLMSYVPAVLVIVTANTFARTLIRVNQINTATLGDALASAIIGGGSVAATGAAAASAAGVSVSAIASALLSSPIYVLPAIISMLAALALILLFYLRGVLLMVYVSFLPVLVALYWTDLPFVSAAAKRALTYFVGIVILPLPGAAIIWGYQQLLLHYAGATAFLSTLGLPLLALLFPIVLLWASVKALTLADPITQRVIGGAVRGGAGATLAGGALAAGASPYLAYQLSRGRVGRAGAYATGDAATEGNLFPGGLRTENDDSNQ